MLGLLAAAPLAAQLRDCQVAAQGYKVFLDDVAYSASGSAAAADAKNFMNRLRLRLRSSLEQMKAETRLPLTVVRCEGRQPRDENEFSLKLVDALNSNNVLLEVWGSVIPGTGRSHEALIGYLLVPVRLQASSSPDVPGVYEVRYEIGTGLEPANLVELFGEALELRAFVSLAAGLKAYRERKYDEAHYCLCQSATLAGRLQAQGIETARGPLRQFSLTLAQQTARAARQDSAYRGRLLLIDPASGRICPAERTP